jgi:hypothetical protein
MCCQGLPNQDHFPEAAMVHEKIAYLKRFGAKLEETLLDFDDANRMAKEVGLHGAAIEVPGGRNV